MPQSDQDWWSSLDGFGKEWRIELTKMMRLKEGGSPTDAQLGKLLASPRLSLYFASAGVIDLEPLRRFPKLTWLQLQGFKRLDNTTLLGKLVGLKNLQIRANRLTDISFVKGLKGLEELDVMNNQLVDVSAVAGLVNLKDLNVGYNKLTQIDAVKKLTQLTKLWIPLNRIDDLTPLANLLALTELKANNNLYADLTPLAKLVNLVELDVGGPFGKGRLTSVAPLAGLTKLQILDISSNEKITDLSPLRGCASLKVLSCQVMASNLNGFAELVGLKKLQQINSHREIVKKADRDLFKRLRPKVELALG